MAVVGAGWWSQGWHLPHLHAHPDVDLCGIVEPSLQPRSTLNPDMDSVPQLREKYSAPTFDTFEELLASGLELDGVVCAAPHAAHYDVGMKAMDRGLNVFMEKPMTTDLEEAKGLAKKTISSGKIFMVNNTANWRPKTRTAHEMVHRGDIGEIKHASIVFHAPLSFIFEDPDNVGWNEPSGTMVGNGFGWGQLSHTFGWLYMVSGLTPTKVFTFAGHSQNTGADIYDAITILCDNGATVTVSGVATIPGCCKVIENRLVGTEGMLAYCGKVKTQQKQKQKKTKHNTRTYIPYACKQFDALPRNFPRSFTVHSIFVYRSSLFLLFASFFCN